LGRVLRHHEVTVVLAAKRALDLLETGSRFDVIFADLMMPEMSGMDFYDELERRFPDAARSVIFVSSGAFTPRAHAFLDRVTNARIDKPFDLLAVRSLVERHLIKRPRRALSTILLPLDLQAEALLPRA
jgi:CheY-like chemotaxis protein